MGRLVWKGAEIERKVTEAAREALDETVKAAAEAAKRRAPARTGTLRASITTQDAGELRRRWGASAPYAIFVEFGTRFMRARPFLRPAADSENRRLVERIRRRLP